MASGYCHHCGYQGELTTHACNAILKARLETAQKNYDQLNEKLRELQFSGWRSCVDHIIKKDDPCPVCTLNTVSNLLDDALKRMRGG